MRGMMIALVAAALGGCAGTTPETIRLAHGEGGSGCERLLRIGAANFDLARPEHAIENALCWIERHSPYGNLPPPQLWLELHPYHMHQLSAWMPAGSATALYNCREKAVYFRKGFNQARLGDQSVLLHELVHHAQCVQGQFARDPAAACAREREAYGLQAKFLRYVAGQRPDDGESAKLVEAAAKLEAGREEVCRKMGVAR